MHGQGAVIVAVIAMSVMKYSIAEVVVVIAMRHLLVTQGLMVAVAGHGRAGCGIRATYRNSMLIVMIAMPKVQMALVQVIDVALVLNSYMTTHVAMNM